MQDTRPGVQACAASASADPRSQMPVARSTLLLQKLPEQQLSALDARWQDDVLRYGQKIRLLAHPAAQVGVHGTAYSTAQQRSPALPLATVLHDLWAASPACDNQGSPAQLRTESVLAAR